MAGRHERGDDQLTLNRHSAGHRFVNRDLHQVAGLDSELFRKSGTHQRRVVPCQLRNWTGQFLEPAVICVSAVVHCITADEHNLRRICRGRWRRCPGILNERTYSPRIKRRRLITRLNVRRKSIVEKTRPSGWKIPARICPAESFLHQLGPFRFRPTEQRVEQFDFRETAEKRQNHRLDRQVFAIGGERVPPRFQIMCGRNMPLA